MSGVEQKKNHYYFSIDLEASVNAIIRKKISINVSKTKFSLYALDTIIYKPKEFVGKY